ncbi:hypothetical protein K435DRAFT_861424 [Dendrothele bispora CBS 962.96]|uniref:Uncharacterized protein n=1 Tax=Dendrothele bispora (strain CBS 962.96) TaxID=1314807 RepID=A0A4V6T5C6_DENBC|nr:hypothetical protein K435DRAFT_861424 [Dendrothele bispora CBS 962.96]
MAKATSPTSDPPFRTTSNLFRANKFWSSNSRSQDISFSLFPMVSSTILAGTTPSNRRHASNSANVPVEVFPPDLMIRVEPTLRYKPEPGGLRFNKQGPDLARRCKVGEMESGRNRKRKGWKSEEMESVHAQVRSTEKGDGRGAYYNPSPPLLSWSLLIRSTLFVLSSPPFLAYESFPQLVDPTGTRPSLIPTPLISITRSRKLFPDDSITLGRDFSESPTVPIPSFLTDNLPFIRLYRHRVPTGLSSVVLHSKYVRFDHKTTPLQHVRTLPTMAPLGCDTQSSLVPPVSTITSRRFPEPNLCSFAFFYLHPEPLIPTYNISLLFPSASPTGP